MAQKNSKSKIKIIHTNLINELIEGHVGHNPKSKSYSKWKGGFKKYCDRPVQYDGSVMENFEYLEETDQIRPSNYTVLLDIFTGDREAIEKIKEAENEIKDIFGKESSDIGKRPIQVADPSAAYGNNTEAMYNMNTGQQREAQAAGEMTTYAKIQVIKTDGENTFGKKMTNKFRNYFNDLRLSDPALPMIEIGYKFTHDREMEERYRPFHIKVKNVITELANLLENLNLNGISPRATKISQTWFLLLRNVEIKHRLSVCEVGWNNHITILVKIHKESPKEYDNLKREVVSRFIEVYREIGQEARFTATVESLTSTEADDLRDTLRRNES